MAVAGVARPTGAAEGGDLRLEDVWCALGPHKWLVTAAGYHVWERGLETAK